MVSNEDRRKNLPIGTCFRPHSVLVLAFPDHVGKVSRRGGESAAIVLAALAVPGLEGGNLGTPGVANLTKTKDKHNKIFTRRHTLLKKQGNENIRTLLQELECQYRDAWSVSVPA